MLYIFDLDHTTIDSSHRANTLPDGSLDLTAWRENSTPEKVARDSLLPLGEQWRDMVARGLTGSGVQIAIITARVMSPADIKFLEDNGLYYDFLYSRDDGDNTPDDAFKKIALYKLASDLNRSIVYLRQFARFYDDNEAVLAMGSNLGLTMVNSTLYNKKAL